MCFDSTLLMLLKVFWTKEQVCYGYVSRLSDRMWRIQNSLGFLRVKSFVTEDELKCIQVRLKTVL